MTPPRLSFGGGEYGTILSFMAQKLSHSDEGSPGKITQKSHSDDAAPTVPLLKVTGTPNYLAVELLLGAQPSPASDFWALGVCLYEFFYGCKPFGGASAADIFQAELDCEPEYFADAPAAASDLMQKLLVKDPNKRI